MPQQQRERKRQSAARVEERQACKEVPQANAGFFALACASAVYIKSKTEKVARKQKSAASAQKDRCPGARNV